MFDRRRDSGNLTALAAVLAIALVFFGAAGTAVARAEPPELLAELSPEGSQTGSGAGQFDRAVGIATNPDNGHIYVADAGNNRIDEFTPWGVFVRAFGWGVRDGSAEAQTCTALTGCQAGIAGGGNGQLSFPNGVAVDSEGDLYVTDRGNHRVDKFDSEGSFILAWGGDVVASGPDNSAQDAEQEVVVAATSGTFKLSFADPLGGSSTATTAPLPYNATAAEVEAALNGLSTIASHGGSVSVSGGPGNGTGSNPYLVTFEGSFAGNRVGLRLQLDRSSLGAPEPGARLVCDTSLVADTKEVRWVADEVRWLADTIEYRWLRDGEQIAGATAPTYVTGAEDEGAAIQCQVTARNANTGDLFIATPAYLAPPEPATAPPSPPASVKVELTSGQLNPELPDGSILTCNPGAWQNASSFSYRWYHDGARIPGASAQAYEATPADVANRGTFQCEAVGHNAGGAVAMASETRVTRYTPNPPAPRPAEGEAGAAMEGVRAVATGGGAEICRDGAGDVCKAGVTGRAPGEFEVAWLGGFEAWSHFAGSLIATGPGDTLYVGDYGRIQEFEADGSFKAQLPLAGAVHGLAVDPAGNVYFTIEGARQVAHLYASDYNVRKLDPAGTLIAELELSGELEGTQVFHDFADALATDSAGDLYAAIESFSGFSNEILEFDPDGNPLIALGSNFPIDPGERIVRPGFRGLATNGIGDLLAGWHEPASSVNPEGEYLNIYGPSPIAYEPPPAAAPEVVEQFASKAGTDSAAVRAKINPKFWPDATYRVQYGTAPCEEGGCQETEAAPLTSKSVNSGILTAPVALPGLAEGTTYHYRFVSQSSGGGPTYGPDQTFRTYRAAPAALPDSRAYEQVSPPNKDGGEVGTPGAASGAAQLSVQPLQASPGGEAITYSSYTSFGAGESAAASSQYLSRPAPGGRWSTENLTPRFAEGYARDPLVGFSEDLSKAAVIAIEPPLTADATVGWPDLYARDNATGALTAITTEAHRPRIAIEKKYYCLMFAGASEGFGRVYFAAKGALDEGDPVPGDPNYYNLYEWSPATGIALASVLPDGSAAALGNSGFGAGSPDASCSGRAMLLRHAVSADGSRAFWTYEGSYETAANPLFARLGGTQTLRLDKPNEGTSGKGGEGRYQDASLDGSKVFLTSPKRLTSTPTKLEGGGDLYRYDFGAPEGQRLTDLTPHTGEAADVQGTIGASSDGAYAYLVAKGVLDEEPNGAGEEAQAGAFNLYAWHEGAGVRFIARLGGEDWGDWASNPENQTARLSPDGRHLAYLAGGQAYLYDYGAASPTCASCNAAGTRPLGPASFPGWSTPYSQPRYLSADGARLFFETKDRLTPADENERRDVYELERAGTGSCTASDPSYNPTAGGCQYLLSSGKSNDASYFVDASESGADAFLSTREGLVYGDSDGSYDIYDARVGGTSPQPPAPLCEGEACREGASSPPSSPTPATLGFQGPGNPAAPHCRKGRHLVTRKGRARCVKKHAKRRRHHRHRHRHHRRRHR